MKIKQLTCALLLALGLTANAANTVTKVAQVSSEVTLSENVDYVVTGTTPFAEGGKVNITNTDHAVLIIENIRPSHVLNQKLLDGHVFINGEQAVNGENCQVRMYAHGAIVFPYAKDIKPLTVYSEQNYGGTAVSDFGLEHSGGFMNSLTDDKLNNQIRSFKLKRGYMVTFATGKSGWGYSRCFIADTEDLEFAELPAHMDARISSYRVFQWHDAQKKGLASDTRMAQNEMLGTTYCYDWAQGFSHLPDRECVPHQIYVAWPSVATCGSVDFSCHMQTNNEPGNSADDTPQSVEVILNQWQELMRTGMRLCSESSHDGSWGHLNEFIAEVDARGWRCDILDLHCYWAGGFGNMEYYYNKYGKRPIWITEWVWGASWNNNGIFATDRSFSASNQQKNLNEVRNILTTLNNSPYVERYAYWNGEADCSKLFRGESEMSLTGNYYRDMKSGMAYRKEYEKVPNVVYTAPSEVIGAWGNQAEGAYRISWKDTNYDMLDDMQVQRRMEGEETFTVVGSVKPIDQNAKVRSCAFVDTITVPGVYEYRVVNITADGKQRTSGVIKAAKSPTQSVVGLQYGEVLMVDASEIKIDFSEDFEDVPAIFMGALSNANSKLYLGNIISGVGRGYFEFTPFPWNASAEEEFEETESIPFMALAEGNYKFSNLDSEVGVAKVTMKDTAEVVFAQPFPEGVVPVVLTELRKPVIKKTAMEVKVHEITNKGFKCIVMVEEGAPVSSASYNVCYMAITPGVGVVDDAADLMIAAGRNEATMYGSTPRPNYFIHAGDTLRFVNPYVFADLQTHVYDAATMVRKQEVDIVEKYNGVEYTIGARFRRITDAGRKTSSDGTRLNATSMRDDLGWVALFTRTEGTSGPTAGIESVVTESARVRPYVVDGVIRVDGAEAFEVYSALGVKVDAHQPQRPGVYVVRTATQTSMVVVR